MARDMEDQLDEIISALELARATIVGLSAEVEAYRDIMNGSEGVTGWHLDGDVATWDEFEIPTYEGEVPKSNGL